MHMCLFVLIYHEFRKIITTSFDFILILFEKSLPDKMKPICWSLIHLPITYLGGHKDLHIRANSGERSPPPLESPSAHVTPWIRSVPKNFYC